MVPEEVILIGNNKIKWWDEIIMDLSDRVITRKTCLVTTFIYFLYSIFNFGITFIIIYFNGHNLNLSLIIGVCTQILSFITMNLFYCSPLVSNKVLIFLGLYGLVTLILSISISAGYLVGEFIIIGFVIWAFLFVMLSLAIAIIYRCIKMEHPNYNSY